MDNLVITSPLIVSEPVVLRVSRGVVSRKGCRDHNNGVRFIGVTGGYVREGRNVTKGAKWTNGVQRKFFGHSETSRGKETKAIKRKSIVKGIVCLTINDLGELLPIDLSGRQGTSNLGQGMKNLDLASLGVNDKENWELEQCEDWERKKWKKHKVCVVRDFPPGCGPACHINNIEARIQKASIEEPEEDTNS
ncbi:hypothetical protein L1987_21092 [Smallanthus sonchifolius]|uniref:Uncharacterized protein n=1 Tax=Smallanthus sonchifolius TaxID=185202 RepID=A0ACB9IU67_9ASTR|nr:hypothetical protein L1987_21092 [Smallanthus sonchifolius]